jgi:UDP-3-O-[3-hydroxymyristoyl] N-acetylglucosamine deacetylase
MTPQIITVSGIGIHSGKPCIVEIRQAVSGSGIVFQTPSGPIPAVPQSVVETTRCTVLGHQNARVSTVEHLLSACAALGIADLSITVDGPELPILDGSAAEWTRLLAPRARPLMLRPLTKPLVLPGRNGAFIAAYPSSKLTITTAIAFEHDLVGTQLARFDVETDNYQETIAPARTFGFIEEVEKLLAAGLALGGSLENAVVVYPDRYEPELHFENELARHKLLDLLGDLWLAGFLPKADIIAVKPSHALNTAFAARLALLS